MSDNVTWIPTSGSISLLRPARDHELYPTSPILSGTNEYCNLIPIHHLGVGFETCRERLDDSVLRALFADAYQEMSTTEKLAFLEVKKTQLLPRVFQVTREWSKHSCYGQATRLVDTEWSVSYLYPQGARISNNTKQLEEAFTGEPCRSFRLRTIDGYVGDYTFIVGNTLVIMPVVLPANYYYQRLHILATGHIDLSKVIFLVDRRLEDRTFSVPAASVIYHGRLRDYLMKTTAQIALVPAGFIQDACFIKARYPRMTLMEHTLLKDSVIACFHSYVTKGVIDPRILVLPTPKLPAPGENPLVGAVTNTEAAVSRLEELVGRMARTAQPVQ